MLLSPGPPLRVHGLEVSYFTGKLEAALRAKGLAYVLVDMDTRSFRACARRTGVAQMPQLELPDGRWLTDTTAILQWLDHAVPQPAIAPADPALNFMASLLEDFADEWLWRPAMYYRWAFTADARRVSDRLARTMLRDVPLPLAVRRWLIAVRQRWLFLTNDGITPTTAPVVQSLYPQVLQAMQAALATRAFLLGARPTQADFGFFGAMYRHFATDPTPAALMQSQAPLVVQWVARMAHPELQRSAGAGQTAGVPDALPDTPSADQPNASPDVLPPGLSPLLAMVCDDYLVYLRRNADAWDARQRRVRWVCRGVDFNTPVNPYRVWCLQQLGEQYRALDAASREKVKTWIGACGAMQTAATLQLLADDRKGRRPAPVAPWMRTASASERTSPHERQSKSESESEIKTSQGAQIASTQRPLNSHWK